MSWFPTTRRLLPVVAVLTVSTLSGCGSIRGERELVGRDGVAHDAAMVRRPAATVGAAQQEPAVVAVDADTPTPVAMRFAGDLVDGGTTTGTELASTGPVHLVFFQPTCPFSIEEGPELAEAARRHPDITYVVAHSGGTTADYRNVIAAAALDVSNIVHLDDTDQSLWRRFGVTSSPSSILVDGDGLLRSTRGALGESGLDRAAETVRTGF